MWGVLSLSVLSNIDEDQNLFDFGGGGWALMVCVCMSDVPLSVLPSNILVISNIFAVTNACTI